MKYPKHKPARNNIDNTGIYIIVIFCSFGCKPGFTNNQICIAAKGIVQTIANTVAIEKKIHNTSLGPRTVNFIGKSFTSQK
ncbi:Uncharacterised protein [Streptococcus pneumoniae]|nr:Uncharacterised protein [Streptococcus pneumoniae]